MTNLQTEPLIDFATSNEEKQEVLVQIVTRLIRNKKVELIPLAKKMTEGILGLSCMRTGQLNAFIADELLRHIDGQPDSNPSDIIKADRAIYKSPIIQATQERFKIFQNELRNHLEHLKTDEEVRIASIPCGYMRDLLTLQTTKKNITFIGIDCDPLALEGAKNFATRLEIDNVEFRIADAINLPCKADFHIITSNGLNIYLCDEKVLELYRSFHHALHKDGMLITSQTTTPDEWNHEMIDQKMLEFERQFFGGIIGPKLTPYPRSSERTTLQLEEAGFSVERIIPDKARRIPMFVAKKKDSN